jgi:hypothetical protein
LNTGVIHEPPLYLVRREDDRTHWVSQLCPVVLVFLTPVILRLRLTSCVSHELFIELREVHHVILVQLELRQRMFGRRWRFKCGLASSTSRHCIYDAWLGCWRWSSMVASGDESDGGQARSNWWRAVGKGRCDTNVAPWRRRRVVMKRITCLYLRNHRWIMKNRMLFVSMSRLAHDVATALGPARSARHPVDLATMR